MHIYVVKIRAVSEEKPTFIYAIDLASEYLFILSSKVLQETRFFFLHVHSHDKKRKSLINTPRKLMLNVSNAHRRLYNPR